MRGHELRVELAPLSGAPRGEWALALMRYIPPSSRAEPSFFTLDVVRLLRQIENSAERARRRGEPSVDVAALRSELGFGDEVAA